jgi:hypothetical protein
MSHPSQAEERRTEIALFRYTLILPILREPSARAKQQMRRNLAAVLYDIPHSNRRQISVTTLRRWEERYRAGGFDALKPQPRSDRGQPRAVSAETLDRAEALKREQPFRSARSIARILSMDHTNPVPEANLAPRTLRRQLARRGATTAQLLTEQRPKAFRRFERSAFGDLWQGDAMHGPTLPDPALPAVAEQQRQVFLFAFFDDHTRLVPHAQFYWNEQLPRMEDSVPLFLGIVSNEPSSGMASPWPSTLIGVRSILPSSSIPSAPPSVSNGSWPAPTPPKVRARSNAFSALSAPIFCPN